MSIFKDVIIQICSQCYLIEPYPNSSIPVDSKLVLKSLVLGQAGDSAGSAALSIGAVKFVPLLFFDLACGGV